MEMTWFVLGGVLTVLVAGAFGAEANRSEPGPADQAQPVIDAVEKACLERSVFMLGPAKAQRLAELVRQAKPKLVVECGTAIGYSGLWIARELKRAGGGRLITIEIVPTNAREAEANFRRAGLEKFVTVKIGDARKVVTEIEGPIDFLFLDCGYSNYRPCLVAVEEKLRPGATVVADNAGIGSSSMDDYLKLVRAKYRSRTEWFDIKLPWSERDAMEVTVIAKPKP
jgi:predicted O-methyltransferase YrrM